MKTENDFGSITVKDSGEFENYMDSVYRLDESPLRFSNSNVMFSAVIEDNVLIGDNCFIGHNVVIRRGTEIGDNVVIGHNTTIEENVFIGDNTRIQANCYITKLTIIEKDVFIGPMVSTFNDKYICSHGRPEKSRLEGAFIKAGARIGGGSRIGPAVIIGNNAFIGMGSNVVKDCEENKMYWGNPAKYHGEVPEDERL